ncbi:choice-of-anchor D domain-containing protein [Candidatus Chrysopegis kryptomonas]|uniref:HYDIN/VesB/CFA65-like Ig-like domain-containing protein n=1 Tax=Candidatus Chryseopegocella kryptomonas TaxID=1633643 RepID=A0A0P1NWY3_9BACT|nr:choice-of-anchor D domain-containing protein [Candidatus Chrysopegis kryptomonas]CUT04138.1 hypothetical protein JGI23_01644 [Candidatus Chrysopegis kryptomonas]
MENKWIGTNGGGLVVYREGGVILVGKPIINVKTNNLNFGFGYLNVTKYNTLKVFNTGYDTLKITGIYTTDIRFRYEGGLPVVVLPGDSAGLVFSFRPNVSGEYVDTAVIVSNSSVNSNLKVALRGRGVKPPYISSSLDTLRFGRVFVSDSVSLSFKLYNSGEIDSVRIFRVEVNEPFYVETFSSLIGPGDSGVVRVKFKPISGGEFTSEMRIISNAWNDTFRVYVSGIASPVVVNSFRNVQSGVLKFVYRVRTVEVLNLTNFEYSTDGGSSWKVGSNISGRLNNITGDVIDTIYWDSRGNLSGYEGFVKVRFKFSSGTNDYFVNVDGVGVDNLAPRFEGVVSGSGDTNRVRLVWRRALDMSLIRYRIYYSANSGVYNFNNPAFEVSDTFAVVSGLENFRRYYFVVRAVDEFGNMDTNKVEISVIPGFRASITSLSVLSDKLSGDVRIVYKVNSVNGDSVGLRFYYSLDGGVNWFSSVNLIGGDRKITSFPHTDTLVWRSKLDTMVETNRCVVKIVPGGRGGTGDEMRSGEFTLDNLAPRFGGIKSGVNLPFNKVVLKWDEAIDISKPLRYKIFVSSTGQFDFTKPYAETDKDSVLVSELETSRSYYFVVKVSDAFGQETSS